ncbi:hypothetical protein ACTI_00060 [Actinoplanes sp. OR16]|uniref:PKD domain-containing protein n=1 Tax=Actinoplanes sp. OR16 TaxID=946334 RepID=UPI000F6CF464|nr:PKD domain-containing protein [Actinoplanes sp. OR16]BBH63321.1 hypothetical protein ACTI_00060 [Actinoplanes sp. OR16]
MLRPRSLGNAATGLVLAAGTVLVPATAATATTAAVCATTATGALQITADCVDPAYAKPVVDTEQDSTSPVPHHRITGHFDGTDVKFTVYLPPARQWQGRFFQYTYPLTDQNALDRVVAFGAASGAYTVQASGTQGYRHAAATAKFAETLAAAYYKSGNRRIYGYLYGPSGGSYQTVGAIENTTGVWDGAVPIVLGVPTSIPTNFFVRAQARLVLRDVAGRIADAVRPGGSGNPYAGLTPVQAAALREATALGVPLRAWADPDYVLGVNTTDGLLGFGAVIRQIDPGYAGDFWTRPGYLGTEQSALGDIVRAALVDVTATVTAVTPTTVTLTGLPPISSTLGLEFSTGAGPLTGTLDAATGVLTVTGGDTGGLTAGTKIRVDNRWFVALPSYYRHQVPAADQGYTAFDVLRDASGQPRYPQRAVQAGPLIAGGITGGGTYSGAINGKVIVVDNLLDSDAYPWHADWYAQRVRAALGDRAFTANFRLYYNDNADHLEGEPTGAKAGRIVAYDPIVEQALRDVAAWAERDVTPPRSSRYTVTAGQISVPKTASERRGIQPVVDLTVHGRDIVTVKAGQKVTFTAGVQAAPGAGVIVSAGWDFTGSGVFTPASVGRPRSSVTVTASHRFTAPGTYYVSLKAAASRTAAPGTYAQVENLDRVRVVVQP